MSKYISPEEVASEELLDICKRSAENFRTKGGDLFGVSWMDVPLGGN